MRVRVDEPAANDEPEAYPASNIRLLVAEAVPLKVSADALELSVSKVRPFVIPLNMVSPVMVVAVVAV